MFLAVHHSMDIIDLQRVTDASIRYIRDFDNVALQIATAWCERRLSVPSEALDWADQHPDDSMTKPQWAAGVLLTAEVYGAPRVGDFVNERRRDLAAMRAAGMNFTAAVEHINDRLCAAHRDRAH